MKCNIGKTDRIVRVLIGLAIIWAGLYYENWWGSSASSRSLPPSSATARPTSRSNSPPAERTIDPSPRSERNPFCL